METTLLRIEGGQGLELGYRPGLPEDGEFLRELYASTRDDLASLGFPPVALESLIDLQLRARDLSYGTRYPRGERFVVELGRARVGSFLVSEEGDAAQLVDIAVLPEYRCRGIGRSVIRMLQGRAASCGLPLSLSVMRNNPRALALYLELGFVARGGDEVSLAMRWEGDAGELSAEPKLTAQGSVWSLRVPQ
jgi:Acetyltransferases